ncbi:MAG TPA: gluconokinase [Burkholderiales bacterium]|nr:gluconokinase [Burkholderiales bacterium]
MILVLMGVSGVGKTTIGVELARRLGWRFIDADDYHPPGNVAKMAAGTPLTDADRWPWLDTLNKELKSAAEAVVACSALKEVYRQRLLDGIRDYKLVFLTGSFHLIRSRLSERRHRYMPASLLESQFATLEPPERATEIDVAASVDACVEAILKKLTLP